ncbi:MAG: FCD domain-containing protein [Octadecabacter sp.]|nr:FCD domain-containing protein [Octadecabacter sp.]
MSNVKSTRASDVLVEYFEQRILDGSLPAGATLPAEREIVQEHGVSRTVVREAVLALANKGLIKAQPRFRPVVVKPGYDTALDVVGSVVSQLLRDSSGVRNLFDMRIMMEVNLVRHAALNASGEDIAKLEEALAANGAAIEDSVRFYETDIGFHKVLYEIPKNPILPAIHAAYTDWLSVHWRQMPRMPSRNQVNFEAHTRIFDAILRRQPDQAEAALREHLKFAWDQVSEELDGQDGR